MMGFALLNPSYAFIRAIALCAVPRADGEVKCFDQSATAATQVNP
jgi:hypothetical protein